MSTYATPAQDEWDLSGCLHCGADLIRNYDGLGTGFSHVYDDEPMYDGTKQCRTARETCAHCILGLSPELCEH